MADQEPGRRRGRGGGGGGGGSRSGGRDNNASRRRSNGGRGGRQNPSNLQAASASNPGSSTGGGGVYRKQGDDKSENMGVQVGNMVMDSGDRDASGLEALLAQFNRENPKRLQEIIRKTTNLCFPNGTLLAAACSSGRDAAADLLLRYGANPDQRCASGSTALVLACFNGRINCVRLLLGLPQSLRGPMAVVPTSTLAPRPQAACARIATPGGHALIHACRGADEGAAEEITRALLRADSSLATQVVEGGIALHAAAASGFPRVLEILLSPEHYPSADMNPVDNRVMQLECRNADDLCALQIAEKTCETEMKREREEQQHAARVARTTGGGSGGGGGGSGGGGGGGGRGGAGGGGRATPRGTRSRRLERGSRVTRWRRWWQRR